MIYNIEELRQEMIERLGDNKRMRFPVEEQHGFSYEKGEVTFYVANGELRMNESRKAFHTFPNAPRGISFREFGKEVSDNVLSRWCAEIHLALDMEGKSELSSIEKKED